MDNIKDKASMESLLGQSREQWDGSSAVDNIKFISSLSYGEKLILAPSNEQYNGLLHVYLF